MIYASHMKERILYHICRANISYGLPYIISHSDISFHIAPPPLLCYDTHRDGDNMEKNIYVFVIIFILVVIPIALYLILKPMFQHNKLLNGVVNYDTFMRKYVFCIDLTKELFYTQLKTHNIYDVLEHSLNDDCSVITFTMYNMKYSYKIKTDDFNGAIILKVEQIQLTSKPAFRINEFFIKKFNATPLEFEKYSF